MPPCPDWSDVGFYLESGTVTIHVQYFGYKSLQGKSVSLDFYQFPALILTERLRRKVSHGVHTKLSIIDAEKSCTTSFVLTVSLLLYC